MADEQNVTNRQRQSRARGLKHGGKGRLTRHRWLTLQNNPTKHQTTHTKTRRAKRHPPVETPVCRIGAVWQSAHSCEWRCSTAASGPPIGGHPSGWGGAREARTHRPGGCWSGIHRGGPLARYSDASPALYCCPRGTRDYHMGLSHHLFVGQTRRELDKTTMRENHTLKRTTCRD